MCHLPVSEGFKTAKRENFGLPHIIAKAHLKLENLPPLKNCAGSTLLEFARHLEIADRTLRGMGPDYVGDLNHSNTLIELSRKLPFSLRGKWAECAGKVIEAGGRPKFSDLLKFVKHRAKLVNNEFGDLIASAESEEKRGRTLTRITTLVTNADPDHSEEQSSARREIGTNRSCSVCSGQHGLWRCEKFRDLSSRDRVKTVLNKRLCFKCLGGGISKTVVLRKHFKCQVQGCVEDHNTLLHPTPPTLEENPQQTNAAMGYTSATHRTDQDGQRGGRASVTAATGTGERRVCLGVVPLKVRAKGGGRVVETYALLDSGSEVTLCKEQLFLELGSWGLKRYYELQGVTGTRKVEGHVIDIVVMSIDNKVSEELTNVRTVEQIPVSSTCIPRKDDISNWPHLRDVELLESSVSDVGLIIGLKEKPTLFIPLECRSGGDSKPVAARYSLGWTVVGPLSGTRVDECCSVNFVHLGNKEFYVDAEQSHKDGSAEPRNIKGVIERSSVSGVVDGTFLCDEEDTKRQIRDEILQEQLERLWSTDFTNSVVSSSVSPSIEDKRALQMMEQSLKVVNGHFQVELPWRTNPPYLPNNRLKVERRAALLKKRLYSETKICSPSTTQP